jgi:uncharacterized protein YraI
MVAMLECHSNRRRILMIPKLTLVAAAFVLSASAASAQSCMVSDPTGTPLNVRAKPGGTILGTLRNGSNVQLIDTIDDSRGRRWAEVSARGYGQSVWVFREFVSCRN